MSFLRGFGRERHANVTNQRLDNILNTAEFQLSAAETMVLEQRAELPSVSPNPLFPVLKDRSDRSGVGAIWSVLYRKSLVALFTMTVSIGLIWSYFTLTPTDPANATWKNSKKVVALAPVVKPKLEEAKLVVAVKEQVPVKSFGFDTEKHASETQIDTANHSMSYVKTARQEGTGGSFAPDTKITAASNQELRLRPVSGSDSRYAASKGGVEWQGGWQAENAAANAERGTKYLEYLKQNGAQASANSLRSVGPKTSNATATLNFEPKLEGGIQRYGK